MADVPHCGSGIFCNILNSIVGKFVYFKYIQNLVGPAGYFKTHHDMETYLKFSSFLADLNNEREVKNSEYKRRMMDLNRILLIKFGDDSMIIPKETAHFEFFDKNDKVVALKDSQFYQDDFLGVRQLVEDGRR